MKLSREDRTTVIMVSVVLIVSLVTIIIVASIIWGLISQPVNNFINNAQDFLKIQNVDYNFNVPSQNTNNNENTSNNDLDTQETVDQTESKPDESNQNEQANNDTNNQSDVNDSNDQREYNYNFVVGSVNKNIVTEDYTQFPDAIVDDAVLAGYGSGNDVIEGNLNIQIPKIGVNSPVLQGLGSWDLLQEGFWVHPGSFPLGSGEVVMLCHRRHFGPYDPRSCWFIDEVVVGDEIILNYNGTKLKYQVVGSNVFEGEDPLIYSISSEDDYIKIVTCTPLFSNTHRHVVLAKRIS